jgi:peptidoglycan/xylan/chitin deacetylase (PgdA/CDA1 family)
VRWFAGLVVICALAPAALAQHRPWSRSTAPRATWPMPAAGPSSTGHPQLIFTFDDGPQETFTPQLLDELKKRNIHAIFFWVSERVTDPGPRLAARQAVIDRVVREGHIIGDHTIHHPHLCRVPRERAAREIDENRVVFAKLSGLPILFFRTPYGDYCPQVVELLKERGLRHLHWDIDPMEFVDLDGIRAAGTLRRHFAEAARNHERAVVLVHEIHAAGVVAVTLALQWLDAEQARRKAAGEPPIEILSGSDLARERMDPALLAWVRDTGASAGAGLDAALRHVIP